MRGTAILEPTETMAMQSTVHELPAIDERLIMPESGYEIIGGTVFAVSPAYEPHGSRHSKLSALLEAYAAPGYNAASDMLTRTSPIDDFAPDGSIYPAARDPSTGGRRLEELAFEVVSSESLAHAGRKAASLRARGVRRVFAIDVERERGLEWSVETAGWQILAGDAEIADPALALPLLVHDLVSAVTTDDAVARALLAKKNPVLAAAIEHERGLAVAEALARGVIAVLRARGFGPSRAQLATISATLDRALLERWLADAATCGSVEALLAPS
jgi:Uma2 family endonuclease